VVTRRGRWKTVYARGAYWALLGGPSTSPLGDAETVLFPLIWSLILVIPYLLLAVGGVLLWKRSHSVATMMVVLGFAAVLIAMVTSLFESIEYSALEPQGALVIAHHRAVTQVIHWAGLAGLWAASIGLVWHATHQR